MRSEQQAIAKRAIDDAEYALRKAEKHMMTGSNTSSFCDQMQREYKKLVAEYRAKYGEEYDPRWNRGS